VWEAALALSTTTTFWDRVQRANLDAAWRAVQWWQIAGLRLWGWPTEPVLPPDKRFEDRAWQENPFFDLLKQSYLITAQWVKDLAAGFDGLNPDLHRRTSFWSQQIADAFSPTNALLTNPAAIREAYNTGGASLARGIQSFLADVQKGHLSQTPEAALVVGKDLACTPGKVIFRNPLIELIQYTPATEQVYAVPILVIPPWINKYYIMDLRPENSLLKYLVDNGFTVFSISWKNPTGAILDLDWEDYLALGLLEALRVVRTLSDHSRVNLVGYCVGGLMLEVTLAYLAARGDQAANTATYLATHQDFTQAGDLSVFISEPEIHFLEWIMDVNGGYLDARNLAATFNMLRANDLLWHYVTHNYLMGQTPPLHDMLYWNNDGTRVPKRVHSFLLRHFFHKNRLIEPDGVHIKGIGIDVRQINSPAYVVAGLSDHIVPWQGAFKIRDVLGGPVRFVLTEGGHIAGMINPPGKKYGHWVSDGAASDPETWLANANQKSGSWWSDWQSWLAAQSGRHVTPPPTGSPEFPILADAPGTYVLEH
jgi:polyhydroxyalkanoate synthase